MSVADGAAAVIFDLDGTLVDSAPDLAASVDYALNRIGRRAPSRERIRSYIGSGAERLIHRSLTGDIDGVADEALFKSACLNFFAHYEANVCCRTTPYPHAAETLRALVGKGYALACVTNKPSQFTQPLLKKLGLDIHFSLTLSGDSLAAKKPCPDQLLHVADHYALSPQDCVMVGDTLTDVLAARNAAMPVIFVTYGYGNVSDIAATEPAAIVDSLEQIPDLLPQIAAAQERRSSLRA